MQRRAMGELGPIFLVFLWCTATSHALRTVILNGTLNANISVNVNKSVEYIIDYNTLNTSNPVRVNVESQDSDKSAPAIVVVRQRQEVISWELPITVDAGSSKIEYRESSRTLCYTRTETGVEYTDFFKDGDYDGAVLDEQPIITVATSSEKTISVNVSVTQEEDFFLKTSTNYTIVISPSKPRFYFYGFPGTNSTDGSYANTVTLEIFSSNFVCMTVSLQNASCPIYDLNDDITFQGHWETVSNKGGITISKSKFPNGFFLVFVAKGNDFDCSGVYGTENSTREKDVRFIIKPSITYNDYFNAVIITLSTIGIFYVIFGISLCICNSRCYKPRTMESVYEVEESGPSTPTTHNDVSDENVDTVSTNESEFDTLEDMNSHTELILGKPNLCVSDLARKKTHVIIKRSYSYLWHVLTVGLFYLLPVVQLVITYQKVLNDTGNQDLCYYNFLCAHPFGFFSDFNHLFSNIGYVMFGLLFLWITYRREQWHKDLIFDRTYGVPQHYGLFYAIGFALIMEGLLSGSYHICPNHSNFQFDTSFMYVTAVLCMVKIYQTRHPDINASAYATFGILAIAILLGMIGILEANECFWVVFTILHILTCFYLTAQVYYLGSCKFDRGVFLRVFRTIMQDFRAGPIYVIKPLYKSRMVLLIIGNLLNWAMAAYGFYSRADFAVYLLGLFMLNTVYYFTFYIVMKILHKEKMNVLTLLFLAISLTCAVVSMYCFFHKSISWSLMPAQSRYYNQECILMHFYDYHDLWHFLSAIGMFFMFMVLLTLDDDLSHTPRNQIPVF